MKTPLRERGWSGSAEDLLVADLGLAVRQREGQVLAEELLDVGALDIIGLLELDDTEDLHVGLVKSRGLVGRAVGSRTWMERKRARWRAAMSW